LLKLRKPTAFFNQTKVGSLVSMQASPALEFVFGGQMMRGKLDHISPI
jgi:hypothetical protein